VRDISAAAWARAVRGLPALCRFGVVPAIAAGLELGGFSWLIVLSTQLGAVPAAAFQTVFSLHNFGFALAMGFGSAAGVRAGNAVGAGEPQAAAGRSLIAAALAAASMIAIGLVYLLAPAAVIHPFTTDPAVRALGAVMLATLAPFMFLDGVQVTFAYALRSLGDQVAAGVIGIIAFFLVTGGLGWLLVRGGGGPIGLAYAAGAGMLVAALLQGGRMVVISSRLRVRS
jgi:MATE family multidrug resistance protein